MATIVLPACLLLLLLDRTWTYVALVGEGTASKGSSVLTTERPTTSN